MGEASASAAADEFMRTHCRCETCACSSDFMTPPGLLRCNCAEWSKSWLTIPTAVCEAFIFRDKSDEAELDRLIDRWHEAVYQDGPHGEVE